MTSGDKPNRDAEIQTDAELEAVVQEVLRSFVPTETTIDGGLLPSSLGDGVTGSATAVFHLSAPSTPTDATAAMRDELNRVFGGAIRPKRPLGRSR